MSRLKSAEFSIAPRGVASSFPASNTPKEYSDSFRNLYINHAGNAELRQGLIEHSVIDTANTITQLHEFVDASGTEFLFASGGGRIWLHSSVSASWSQVFTFAPPISSSPTIYSYSMNNRIIFYDGVNRSVYTTDGIVFHEQRSILEAGRASIGTSAGALVDLTVSNWVTTDVTQYDLVLYTDLSAYGLVTSVVSARVNHTPVSATAGGIGNTVSASIESTTGSTYQIVDMVELNIIPIAGQDPDNMGVLASGSSSTEIRLSAIPDFTTTMVRKGDVVYNSTRNRVTEVTAISTAALGVAGIDSQASGDEVVLLKSSMPIVSVAHVHFSRSYLVDAREPHKIRISGPNNSQDMGGDGASTLDISTLQPKGEVIKAIHSFQRFFVIGGSRNMYFYEGTVPAAASGEVTDFDIRGSFPIGVLSRGSLSNVGNDCVFVTNSGIQSSSLQKSSDQLVATQSSRQLDRTLRSLLSVTPEAEIIMFNYPRRSWMCIKSGTELFVYNYSIAQGDKFIERAESINEASTGVLDPGKIAWHLFDGPLAQQKCFMVRTNGDLLTGNVQGRIGIFDQGAYADLGQNIGIEYTSAWDNFAGQRSRVLPKISRKQGKGITPFFEAGAPIPVTVRVLAGFEAISSDAVVVTADSAFGVIGVAEIGEWIIGGSDVTNKKHPLRWNGSEAQFSFEASVSAGPFQLTGFVVHYTDGDAA